MKNVAFIKTPDGNMTLVLDGKSYSVGTSHRNYASILEALKTKVYDNLEAMLDISTTIVQRMTPALPANRKITVKDGVVAYNGLPMSNTVTERILEFMRDGLPTEPLARFLENLMANPMPMAVAELYDFLEHRGFAITEDGCFVAYKGVRADGMDAHTGTVDNSIGKVIEMPREKVDPDRRNECSYGYHVGTMDYAKNHAPRLLLVKVNPADCVAVPKDHNCSKLRVCKYEVLSVTDKLIETPMYPMPDPAPRDDDDDYDDDDDILDDPIDQDDESETPVAVAAKPKVKPKRAACTYCGAKGGKAHAFDCKRPRK